MIYWKFYNSVILLLRRINVYFVECEVLGKTITIQVSSWVSLTHNMAEKGHLCPKQSTHFLQGTQCRHWLPRHQLTTQSGEQSTPGGSPSSICVFFATVNSNGFCTVTKEQQTSKQYPLPPLQTGQVMNDGKKKNNKTKIIIQMWARNFTLRDCICLIVLWGCCWQYWNWGSKN